jgi:hypothetical protein
MKQICLASGAVVSEGTWISEQAGNLSVHCEHHCNNTSDLLLSIPHQCWIPIDGIVWEGNLDILRPRVIPTMTDIQTTLFLLTLDLYNATAKIPWTTTNLPLLALVNHRKLAEAAQAVESAFSRTQKSAVDRFIDTRVFSAKNEKERFIVPLVDLINHCSNAPGFLVDDYKNLCVSTFALGGRGHECFCNYNTGLDAFELALNHGFLDENCHFANSAPICVNVAGFGNINVKSTTRPAVTELNMPEIFVDEGTLFISHVLFDKNRPQHNKALLCLGIVSILRRKGLTRPAANIIAEDIFAKIVEANLNLLADVQREALPLLITSRVAQLLHKAAGLKADLIRSVFETNAG